MKEDSKTLPLLQWEGTNIQKVFSNWYVFSHGRGGAECPGKKVLVLTKGKEEYRVRVGTNATRQHHMQVVGEDRKC